LRGSSDNDTLVGTKKGDVIYGEGGNDNINGRNGRDKIYGGKGDDEIVGGREGSRGKVDIIDCGPGNDRVILYKKDMQENCEKVSE
jgi:Ca2+-binding RTX toxin-like protein